MQMLMKTGLFIMMMAITMGGYAQKTDKKVVSFTVNRVIQASADEVWKVVGEDFGGIANSHPKIVSSEFNQGYITGGENASRTCNFNEKGTKYLQEKQISYDAENYTFTSLIYHAGGIPLETGYSYAVYKVTPIDANSCTFSMEMNVRTKPAFMGSLAKGAFKNDIADYLLAVDHHVMTGETVNKESFKAIKKKYKKEGDLKQVTATTK